MSNRKRLHGLLGAAESAASQMREVAYELERIAERTGFFDRRRRDDLTRTAKRLLAVSHALTAEAAAASATSVGLVAKVGRGALFAAVALVSGVGEAIGAEALDRFENLVAVAEKSLSDVEAARESASADEFDSLASQLRDAVSRLHPITPGVPRPDKGGFFTRLQPEQFSALTRESRLGALSTVIRIDSDILATGSVEIGQRTQELIRLVEAQLARLETVAAELTHEERTSP